MTIHHQKTAPVKPEPYRIAVFCSANTEIAQVHFHEAGVFAKGLAARGWEIIYGGAANGLMGHFANESLNAGGRVRGAIPEIFMGDKEIAHTGLTEIVVTKDLFDRKAWMMAKADAFAIFPGGLGTLDEALEVITWKSLMMSEHSLRATAEPEAERTKKIHQKPIVFVNVAGFWQHQLQVFQQFLKEGMIRSERVLSIYDVCETSKEALAVFDAYHNGGKTH